MNSREKGKRGELEACDALQAALGIECRRSVQYSGRSGDADLLCDVDLHIEVKLTERLNPYAFIDQVQRDSKGKKRGLVVMRSNYRPWLVLCRLQDMAAIAQVIDAKRLSVQHPGPIL